MNYYNMFFFFKFQSMSVGNQRNSKFSEDYHFLSNHLEDQWCWPFFVLFCFVLICCEVISQSLDKCWDKSCHLKIEKSSIKFYSITTMPEQCGLGLTQSAWFLFNKNYFSIPSLNPHAQGLFVVSSSLMTEKEVSLCKGIYWVYIPCP